jgi:hypothetical protein
VVAASTAELQGASALRRMWERADVLPCAAWATDTAHFWHLRDSLELPLSVDTDATAEAAARGDRSTQVECTAHFPILLLFIFLFQDFLRVWLRNTCCSSSRMRVLFLQFEKLDTPASFLSRALEVYADRLILGEPDESLLLEGGYTRRSLLLNTHDVEVLHKATNNACAFCLTAFAL